MDMCLDDAVGYDGSIASVADASIESIVSIAARTYKKNAWKNLANRDYVYWEEGEFKNWVAWLRDDDVFWPDAFFFVNGFKIPDGQWTYNADANSIATPLVNDFLIPRLEFVRKGDIFNETIWEIEEFLQLIDPELRNVEEWTATEGKNVFIDEMTSVWKDDDGMPIWGSKDAISDDQYVVVVHPDPREGIIWPISRIRYRFYSCGPDGIDIPDYLGHDLSKYVLAWVDGRNVQCRFEETRIFVPNCQTAKTIEVYVFELHDAVWIDRFDAVPKTFNLHNIRDVRVC